MNKIESRPCEFFDKQTLLLYIGYNKDGLGIEAKEEYRLRYGTEYIAELSNAGWMPGVVDELSGWFDPQNGVHYLPDDAIAVNTMRNRKSRFGK